MEDFVGRTELLDPALVHHHDAVGHFQGLFLVVRDKEAGDVDLVVQTAQPTPQPLPDLRVQGAERLVRQQNIGLDGQGPGQRHALPQPLAPTS